MFNNKVFSVLFALMLIFSSSFAQKKSLIFQQPKLEQEETVKGDESEMVQKVIEDLFDAMRVSKGVNVSHLFENTATLSSVSVNQVGQTQHQTNNVQGFIEAIAKPRNDLWDEKIWDYDIKIDGPLAKAWTPYTFYLNGQVSHCGVNDFELIKKYGSWKITRIIDTRRKNDCTSDPKEAINQLMDNWHKAAAVADEITFFESMTPDGIYIGTDASERWTRNEMKQWSKASFKRESAWSFTSKSRNINLSENGEMAWFDELLDTWMGDCRSSGVVQKIDGEWKIKYYHLSIAVPNDAVEGYLKLIAPPAKGGYLRN